MVDLSLIEAYFDRLWPICRSITGDGLRESFRILQEIIPFELTEVPTGTKVFDWEIPLEWNVRNAYLLTPDGQKIADFQSNNLHLVNYSEPINRKISWQELEPHLHTLPQMPEAIPYITSYYKRTWGFCLTQNQYNQLPREGEYTVLIDSELKNGSLTYGQAVLPGDSDKEILFSSYLCHPSMANNELSGPLTLAFLYRELAKKQQRKYTYRFVLAPETIGVIAFLSRYGSALKENVRGGLVLTCCGDEGAVTYQRSKRDNSESDRVMLNLLQTDGIEYSTRKFDIGGSDERQYCSQGLNLPIGTFMRTPFKVFKEYHTSLDNKDLFSFQSIKTNIEILAKYLEGMEANFTIKPGNIPCEPMLGKRGLYPSKGGLITLPETTQDILRIVTYSDCKNSLLEVAEEIKRPLYALKKSAQIAAENQLIEIDQ
ncbi:MAG: DUF4910 domain-containing protein [Luteibaculum sp.]